MNVRNGKYVSVCESSNVKRKKKQRVAIISVSTLRDSVADFFDYLLSQICLTYDGIIIVSKYSFLNEAREQILKYADALIENIGGNDFYRWKYGIDICQKNFDVRHIADVTILNDSMYGPLYSLDKVFFEMKKKHCDFWGITRHQSLPNEFFKINNIQYFIQIYFINFRTKRINLPLLKNVFTHFEDDSCAEYLLTTYLEKMGFIGDTFVNTSDLENTNPNLAESFLLFMPYTIVCEKKCPFISRYMFTINLETRQLYGDGMQLHKLMNYIKCKYPIQNIYKDLLKQLNIYDLIHVLELNYIYEDGQEYSLFDKESKIAIFIYLYYENLFEKYLKRLSNICFDIYIYTTSYSKKVKLIRIAKKYHLFIHIFVVNSIGRDWAAMLNEMNKEMEKYDIVAFLHDKSFHQFEFPSQAFSFDDLLWDNLLPNCSAINQIINIFYENPHIGVLVPPIVKHGTYYKYYMNFWMDNYQNVMELAKRINISTYNISYQKTPISIGGMFWFRVKALQKLFDANISRNEFPCEPMENDGTIGHALERIIPYIAQEMGYYTGIIMSSSYIKNDWLTQEEMIRILGNKTNAFQYDSLYHLSNNSKINE